MNLSKLIYRYLTIDTEPIPSEELITSDDTKRQELIISDDVKSQEFYLGDLILPCRILIVNLNYFTIFCIFNHGKNLYKI